MPSGKSLTIVPSKSNPRPEITVRHHPERARDVVLPPDVYRAAASAAAWDGMLTEDWIAYRIAEAAGNALFNASQGTCRLASKLADE